MTGAARGLAVTLHMRRTIDGGGGNTTAITGLPRGTHRGWRAAKCRPRALRVTGAEASTLSWRVPARECAPSRGRIYRKRAGRPARNSLAGPVHQVRDAGELLVVDLVRFVAHLVIILVEARRHEQHRHTATCIVVMVAAEIDLLGVRRRIERA